MNLVDLVIILLLIFFCWVGRRKSFVMETLDFLFFLAAFVLSLKFYSLGSDLLENYFHLAHSFALVIGFFLVWSVVEICLSFFISPVLKKIRHLDIIDAKMRLFSFFPAFLRGIITVAILLVLIATFPIQPNIKMAVDSSLLGPKILSQAYGLETPLKNIFGSLSNSYLTFLTVEPKTNESINLGFKTSSYKERLDLENQMIDLVNHERVTRGLRALSFDSKLRAIAIIHSSDMFERGYFSHYSPEGKSVVGRAEDAGIDYQVIGENLAYAPSLTLAHNGLMNSPGHRANILSPDYHRIGIGIMDGGVYGLMITQVFSN